MGRVYRTGESGWSQAKHRCLIAREVHPCFGGALRPDHSRASAWPGTNGPLRVDEGSQRFWRASSRCARRPLRLRVQRLSCRAQPSCRFHRCRRRSATLRCIASCRSSDALWRPRRPSRHRRAESREPSVDPLSVKRRLSCILAADAVGYSKQMEQDEESTIRVLAAHRAVIDGIITFHGGRIISTAGDSVLAEFSSVVEAVRCAVEIQEALKTRNDALPDKSQMHFRVGVNLGDVVVKNDDLLGDGVNVAARLETIAEPGGICISSSVYDQITGKLDLGFQDIGEQTLKNISPPIRVYRVSGTAKPQRSAPSGAAERRAPGSLPWAIAGVVVAVAGVAAWQLGWISFGAPGRVSPGAPAPVAAPTASAPSPPPRADREPTTADAATAKEAQTELVRARSEA